MTNFVSLATIPSVINIYSVVLLIVMQDLFCNIKSQKQKALTPKKTNQMDFWIG